jgi:hypothetical protein
MILGRIDEVDGHFIATKFALGVVPRKCLYVARTSPRATSAGTTDGGVPIRFDWRSVILGYSRVWFPVLAIGLPLAQLALGRVFLTTWLVSAVLTGVSVLAFGAGRLDEPEKARLRLLGSVTGFRIDPTKLLAVTREVKRDVLGDLMEKGGIPTTPDGILSVIDDIPLPAMPLVYGYACYAGDDPSWRECAALVYARYEQGDL